MKYIDGRRVYSARELESFRRTDDGYRAAEQRDEAERERERARQSAIIREQANAEADRQGWGDIVGLYTTPLKRWLYRRAPK
jgi:hypothetical protein